MKDLLNLHAVIRSSAVNGPGRRMVVFFQGCTSGCPGCFNPETHPVEERLLVTVPDLFRDYLAADIEGLTCSGGEPFLQPEGLAHLLREAKEVRGLSTVVYTGFTIEEIRAEPGTATVLKYTDVLIDGPYDERRPEKSLLARGSTNQRFHFLTGRYSLEDFYMPGKVEIEIDRSGIVRGTGFSRLPASFSGL